MRKCVKCQKIKPIYEFPKDKHDPSGIRQECKPCAFPKTYRRG